MTAMQSFDPNRTALLVMDFQADILERYGDSVREVITLTARVVAASRAAGVPIIFVVVGFRPGYPELDLRNSAFASIARSGRLLVTTPGADIAPPLAPRDGDIVIVKHRVSAFAGTDLDQILRARGIESLFLCGVATGGVVLSTLRHAADADYRVTILADCCADPDAEVQRVLTEKVFVRQSTVVWAQDVIDALGRA